MLITNRYFLIFIVILILKIYGNKNNTVYRINLFMIILARPLFKLYTTAKKKMFFDFIFIFKVKIIGHEISNQNTYYGIYQSKNLI